MNMAGLGGVVIQYPQLTESLEYLNYPLKETSSSVLETGDESNYLFNSTESTLSSVLNPESCPLGKLDRSRTKNSHLQE